ncbi:hypothetical protein HELRODRAFT_184023 [Helobdella robusta]|uniref:Uncharacterized protein n=1 Tax=Helobdella robusta TaxID=6412 RepID=T1FKG1_HELRO|nr:hypothetical protein HELRODRAFT_184023 [Helobdella robusta]ESO09184.1 hypothetical protein HELRODRAFT_184023 [Helobdella robusta]
MPGTAVTVTGFKSKNFSAHHFQCVYIVDPRIMQLKLLRIAKIMVVRKNYYEEATETYIGCYREVVEVNAGIVDSYEGCKMLCRNEVTSYIALHECRKVIDSEVLKEFYYFISKTDFQARCFLKI